MPVATWDVAITTYRRPEMVLAAVRSCLSQGPRLRRVIVVDDASGDDTGERLAALGDARIAVHVRAQNGGIGAARRDALERSAADWTVMIDSDHELLPGALARLSELVDGVGERIGIVGARLRWDTGVVTPRILPDHPIDYEERIRWSNRPDSIGQDYLLSVSRYVRERVQWSAERSGMVDALFQLDAAAVADAVFLPECLGYEKSDGPEGHSRGSPEHLLARRRKDAAGGVAVCRLIQERHGPALTRFAPAMLARILKEGAVCAALAGRRLLATRWASRAVALAGPASVSPAIVAACLAGDPLFSWAYRRALARVDPPPPHGRVP